MCFTRERREAAAARGGVVEAGRREVAAAVGHGRERAEEGRRRRCEEAEGAAGPHPGWAAFAFAVGKAMFWVTDPCPVQDPNPRMGTPFR